MNSYVPLMAAAVRAVTGVQRLHVTTRWIGPCLVAMTVAACGGDANGPPEPAQVNAAFGASATLIIEGDSIAFTDQSSGTPTTWNWQFEGGTPSTSSEQNPRTTYTTPGVFRVSLTASNGGSSDAEVKDSLITVECDGVFCQPVFPSVMRTDSVPYGIDPAVQWLNLYEPTGDTRTDRPAILLLGGGGFAFGSNLEFLDPVARAWARYGFVVAAARYRVGDASAGLPFLARMIEANQDAKAAVRYLRSQASALGIDSAMIFNGGNGAGGIAALFAAYVTRDEIDASLHTFLDSLGGLEGAQGTAAYPSDVVGTISLAGAVYSTSQTPTLIDAGEPPLFVVHGDADNELDCDWRSTPGGSYQIGGCSMFDRAVSEGLIAGEYIIPGGGHDAPRTTVDGWVKTMMAWAREVMGR